MSLQIDPQVWEGTPFFLIKEQISSATLPIPSLGGKIPGIKPGMKKLQRMVWQRHAAADVHFMGKPLGRHVGLYEWALEQILPGRQITTKRTGKTNFVVRYYGYLNIATSPIEIMGKKKWEMGWINVLGADPIKDVRLYGNTEIDFISHGGDDDPFAIVQYDGRTKKLTPIDPRNVADTLKKLRVD